MKTKILKLLREAGGYVSGQQISEKFGVSRTAVWKVIRQLQDEGYQVEAVRNKGYHIVESPDVITKEELDSLMKTRWAGRNILYYEETDSTNGHSWSSPAGTSIYMSVLLRPDIAPSKASMLTVVMACSAAEGITQCLAAEGGAVPQVQIKWPNDIIVSGKKLVGILTEMSAQIDYINHVAVGVGINANTTEFPEEIRETATSLRLECGHAVRRAPLIAAVMERLEENYEIFLETEDLSGLMEKYSAMLVNRDRDVRVIGAKETYQAHAVGITPAGELIVRREDGTEEKINAGEVSVRGVYGYV